MLQEPLSEQDQEELINTIREFFIYHNHRVQQTRTIVMCVVILIVFVLLAIWIL